ncbi:hypothetical protein BDY24DRAFT_415056 [Mrakia frigida]|uniref:uncharacterized protein n=1 Tax=Mrakia frigida TaxID=29902 RepID=UPI003FCC20DB
MFDDSDDFIESWCTVCDKQILQPRSSLATLPSSSSVSTLKTSTNEGTAVYKKPPGKYIAPKAPTFKRSKTGTIRAKPLPNALVATNQLPSNVNNGPPPPPAAPPSSSGPLERTSSAGHLETKTALLSSSGSNPTGVEGHSDSSPTTPTPSSSNPRASPATITTTAPTPPSHHHSSGLFCSYACAQLEEERSSTALAPLLSSALSFTSPLHTSWIPGGGPPSPFSLSNGSDSEGGEYFDGVPGGSRAGREGAGERKGSSTSIVGEVGGGTRRGSRSTNTTGSSSDSLQSLWDKDNAAGAAIVPGANHPYHGLKRMTPLVQSKTELDALPPFTVRPISAQNLIPPPPSSPQLYPISSPRRSSASSFSSTGMAFRSSSHSSHRASLHGPAPHHLNPSSYSMSPPPFEPGSAPSTASLYASYAEGFNRTPSAESKLAMYGGRMASPRRGKFFGVDDGHEPSHLGVGGGARPTNMLARRSSEAPSEDDSDSSSTRQPTQTTPTQSILHRPSSPIRRASSALSTSLAPSHRYSSSTSSLSHQGARPIHPPNSRPPPSKTRLASQKSGPSPPEPSTSWSWSSMEKMYEVPRVASAGGAVGGGSSSLGGSKLFYWSP